MKVDVKLKLDPFDVVVYVLDIAYVCLIVSLNIKLGLFALQEKKKISVDKSCQ